MEKSINTSFMDRSITTYCYLVSPRVCYIDFTPEDFYEGYEISKVGDDGETYVAMIDAFVKHPNSYEKYVVFGFYEFESDDNNNIYYYYRITDMNFNIIDRDYGIIENKNAEGFNKQVEINKVIAGILYPLSNKNSEEIHELSINNYIKRYKSKKIKKMIDYI